jgi:hypothetical protein
MDQWLSAIAAGEKPMSRSNKGGSQERALVYATPSSAGGGDFHPGNAITIGIDNSISIDLMKLQAPNNVYDADCVWIEHRPGRFSFFFGKRDLGSANKKLRTRLEIRYPPENLVLNWNRVHDFHVRVQKFIANWPNDEGLEQQKGMEWTADKDHSEWANFETMSHSGTQASIDFYLLPPYGVAQFRNGRGSSQLMVIPIVRVQMTTFELAGLLGSVEEAVAEIKGYIPNLQPETVEAGETEEAGQTEEVR